MANTNKEIRKPVTTKGVDKYTFFKVLTDTASETTYDEAYSLRGTVEVLPTDTGGNAPFEADNGNYLNTSYIEKVGHDITNADIPPTVDAMWRGLEVDEFGGVTVTGNINTVYFGVAWRTLRSDNTYRYFRTYKGSYSFASNVGGKTMPSTGAPEHQTAKATYTAVRRDSDDALYYYLDDAEMTAEQKKEIAEKWFTDIDYLPTKTQPVA